MTGFHIVEHLPLPYLVSMLKEAARTLRPGGIAIFETPNPENVLVGSHTFYLDPTHLKPTPAGDALVLHGSCGIPRRRASCSCILLPPTNSWRPATQRSTPSSTAAFSDLATTR